MQLILLERVKNLGNLGDKVSVKAGFGRNYLIPQGKAIPATSRNIADFEKRRSELEQVQGDKLQQAKIRSARLAELTVVLSRKGVDETKLFGSIGVHDIADAVTAQGVELHKSEVRLPTGPLRLFGEYTIEIHLHADVNAELKLIVVRED
jgi:large subunit ribosomal protein L9